MDDNKIGRINELYKKANEIGLTEEEKNEQASLRAEYILAIRGNLKGTLNNMSLLNPDGSITKVKSKNK